MGGWERNVAIFGVAGIVSVAGLFIGGVFLGVVWTFFVLAIAMFFALGRFGPDRVPFETWLMRRWRYARSVHRYTYARPGTATARGKVQAKAQTPQPAQPASPPAPPAVTPVTFADDKGAYYGAVTVLMVVAGIVFLGWLRAGGDADLARSLLTLFRR